MNKNITSDLIELATANLALVFVKRKKGIALSYFGTKLADSADVPSLQDIDDPYWRDICFAAGNDPCGWTYSTFGGDEMFGMECYGALNAIHSDGVPTTVLEFVTAEEVDDEEGVRHIVFELKDENYEFYVEQHYRAIVDSDVFETWVVLRNGEEGPVSLPKMDSFSADFRGQGHGAVVHHLSGHWGAEGQYCEAALSRGETLSLGSRSGVRAAWHNNPGFMVSVGGKSTETTGRVFGGALAWTGAWEARIHRTVGEALCISSGVCNCSGPYILDSEKSIKLPMFAFTYSEAGRGQISRNFHDWARGHRIPRGRELRPVLLNSWEGAYFNFNEKTLTDMMDGVKELGGEMFVVDDGWFGRDEFARVNDKAGLGDWVWNYKKLPKGPAYLADEAKKRGLRFGLWFEPEMGNTSSELATKHPDWLLREPTRKLRTGRGGTQVVLDMCNPEVRDAIFQMIDKILNDAPGLTYIKWDANADFMNAGSPYLASDRQCNLWFDYTNGVYDLLAKLRAAHPEIMIQACSSGGGHADFGFLGNAEEFWGSDDTCARQRIFIQWGEMQFYPANSVACHVTAVPSHQTGRVTPLKFRFDVAMSGRLGFELHPAKLSEDDVAFAKSAVATYKRLRPVVQQGNLYRLYSPYENPFASILYVDKEKKHAVLFVYGLNRLVYTDRMPAIRLQGLDPARRYRVEEINLPKGAEPHGVYSGRNFGGDALMKIGLNIGLLPEYDSAAIELTALEG